MSVRLIYMTAGSMKEAEKIGGALIESKLAACVNIVDGMRSIYKWQGKLQQDQEVILIAKTEAKHVRELVEKVKFVHSYECPCILSIPVEGGNQAFIEWVLNEVK